MTPEMTLGQAQRELESARNAMSMVEVGADDSQAVARYEAALARRNTLKDQMSAQEKIGVPHDMINHPPHYRTHPSGVECITVTEHMGFNLGNAVKYIWRADHKGDAIADLRKAAWYVQREIARRGGES